MPPSPPHASDPVALAQALIACPSITPTEAGALTCLEEHVRPLGFRCQRLPFDGDDSPPVDNLFARLGDGAPHLCFAGHTDVVPVGDESLWTHPPFEPVIADGKLWGRGASDMKGSIAAFVAASAQFLETHGAPKKGSISLMITGDEEGPAINGTAKMLRWMEAQGMRMDHCLIGEPSNPARLGDMIKIGRRGSLNMVLTVAGRQGHAAYPQHAHNPLPQLTALLSALHAMELDDGSEHFQPSNLEVVALETPSHAFNVIPAWVRARANIRFNDHWTHARLEQHVRAHLDKAAQNMPYTLETFPNGEWFLTKPNQFVTMVQDVVRTISGGEAKLSTDGGTSDGRFIHRYAPVLEFGPLNTSIHQIDEHIALADLAALTEIYRTILERYFSA